MRLEKGGRYAIIGPSGSGKTTIINTITGLYSANSGAIAINESLLDGQHLEEWRRWFTVVSQDNLLFSTTIKENLFFGLDFVSTIIDSDVIFFIEDGYLLDQGDHRELIERCPAYRFFVQNQLLKD